MLEAIARESFQEIFVNKFALHLNRHPWISPNGITAIACVLGILIIPSLFMQYYVLAVVLLLLSGYLDVLDGTLARLRKTSSALGTVYDIIADRIVEFSVIFGLFILAPNERAMACLLMLGSVLLCVTSFLVVGIFSDKKTNKNFDYSPGLIERAEAFMFFIAMILLPKYFLFLAYIFISLVCLTTIARVFEFKRYNVSED